MKRILWLLFFSILIILFVFGYIKLYLPLRPAFGPIRDTSIVVETATSSQSTSFDRWVPIDNGSFMAPDGVSITVFAHKVPGARFMAFDDSGVLYVSLSKEGSVVSLKDTNNDRRVDERTVVLTERDRPHGLAFTEIGQQEYLYIAETGQVIRVLKKSDGTFGEPEVIIKDLPPGGMHWTRSIAIRSDKLYVSTGSSCNVCIEKEPHRAAVWEYNLDGSGGRVYATGLRNSVGLTLHPETQELWATDNGRDWLGDDLPPDEINIIYEGKDYGWPYCYGKRVVDPFGSNEGRCATTIGSVVDFQAHVAPLGLAFYMGSMFPEYRGDMFVAQHGSWNRSVPVGYSLVRLDMEGDTVKSVDDFITGWLVKRNTLGIEEYSSIGRPVDIVVGPDGALYVSDDKAGVVYVIIKA